MYSKWMGTYLPSTSFDSKISKSQLHWRAPTCCLWVGREPGNMVYPKCLEPALMSPPNPQIVTWWLQICLHIISDTCLSFSRRHHLHLSAALAMWNLVLKDISLLSSFLLNWHPNISNPSTELFLSTEIPETEKHRRKLWKERQGKASSRSFITPYASNQAI